MNKSILKSILFGAVCTFSACTSNFEDMNTNPYDATDKDITSDDYNYRAPLVEMQGYVIPADANLFQFNNCLLGGSFGGYLADSNDGFKQKFSTYNPEEHWNQATFNDIIPAVYQTYSKLKYTDNPNQMLLSVAMITKVAALSPVAATYGPIPYSKIGADAKLTAPYDSERDIYTLMFEELDTAIAYLEEHQNELFSPQADKVFGGQVIPWIKFANSLKLRLAVRISNADETLAKQKAEEAVNHPIGIMSSNKDNAFYSLTKNPFKVVMYDYNDGDSRISADITNYMNGFNDPRRSAYFTETTFKGMVEEKPIVNGYYGLRNGVLVPQGDYRMYSNMKVSITDHLLWMNAAESAFLRAEGAIKGWNMGGTAEQLYNEGITLSFEQWSVAGAEAYINNATRIVTNYKDPQGFFSYKGTPSTVTIKWNEAADMETKLEKIITQKWIANFPLGLEAWADYRRTGYPKLMEAVDNKSGGDVVSSRMARRLAYPVTEYKENEIHLQEAISNLLIGPDNMGTDLWWTKKN